MQTRLLEAAAKAILDRLGEDGLLRGEPCRMHIEHGVQVTGVEGGPRAEDRRDMQVERDVISILSTHEPRKGDTVVLLGRSYKLQFRVRDNGVLQRFVVLEVA